MTALTESGARAISAIQRADNQLVAVATEPLGNPERSYRLLKAAEALVEAWRPLCVLDGADYVAKGEADGQER
jgi:hypothetical protein